MRTIRWWPSGSKLCLLVSTFLVVVVLGGCGDFAVVGEPLIAVLDTGIDRQREDLAHKVIAEVNFTDSATACDVHGHGTKVASIIAATAPNARLLNVKVADDTGLVWPSSLVEGIVWAVDHGAHVINMSLYTMAPTPGLKDAVNYAWSQGAVVVAATGDCAGHHPVYPACYSNCLAVGPSWLGQGHADVLAGEQNSSMAAAEISGLAGRLFQVVSDQNGNGFVNDEVWERIARIGRTETY